MSNNAPLAAFPLWALFIITIVAIVLTQECGYRLGRMRGRRANQESHTSVGVMVGAQLSLLAFLLTFTYGIAASRFDTRRQVLLDEANAIGTAYLRAATLPEPQRAEVRRLLREYVDVRITAAQRDSVEQAIRRSEDLLGQLWTEAVAAAEQDPRSVPVGLFVQALNEVIDLHTKRVTAGLRSRIPAPVWAALCAVVILAFVAMGYHSGLTKTSRSPAVLMVVLTFAVVVWLVADLDRPGQGLLRESQQLMIDLRDTMEASTR